MTSENTKYMEPNLTIKCLTVAMPATSGQLVVLL